MATLLEYAVWDSGRSNKYAAIDADLHASARAFVASGRSLPAVKIATESIDSHDSLSHSTDLKPRRDPSVGPTREVAAPISVARHLAAATKKRAHLLIGLLMGIALNGGCMSDPSERMSIDKQVTLSPTHQVMPYQISRASNGDLIVSGSTSSWDGRPWATRVSQNGEVRWEFVEGGPGGWEDKTSEGQRFYRAVELPDQSTVLCGIKVVKTERLVLLDHLALDGSLIAERVIRPTREKSSITKFTCVRWNDGIALVGGVSGFPSGTGWLAQLDAQINLQWEKFGDEYASTDVIEATGGNLLLLNPLLKNPDGSTTAVIRLAPSTKIIARHTFATYEGPQLIRPVAPRSDVRVSLFQDTLKTEIVDLDDQLRGPTRVIKLHNAGVKRSLQLPDGSIAIFGSEFHNTATAAVTRVYKDGSSKGFIVEPPYQSGWYDDAVYTGNKKEFAAVRSMNDTRAVLEWISFR
jgi:hypothetical protein